MMEQSPALGFWDKSSEDHLRIRFPVHRACRDGDTGALSALLAHGEYDLYTEDQFYGWTPAHWSAYHGKLGCLQLLVTAGVNFDVATQRFHQTPAHVAAFGNQPHCLMWLIRSGASVNAQDYLGETPTHKAARCGGIECLGILKANGAIFRTTNNNGHLPKDLALSCSHDLCAHYIQQVDGVPRSTNGFSSGHLGRKRGTEDSTNGDLKKARTENGASAFQEDLNGTENSPSHNGLSVDCPAPHHPNCSNGTQDTPTPSCMNLLPRPQEITPRTLQASEIVSMHNLRPMEYEHDQSSRMETDVSQENGQSNKIDNSGHLSGVVNGQREHSGSELEHNATINQEVDYNRLCDSIYTTVNYCHFF